MTELQRLVSLLDDGSLEWDHLRHVISGLLGEPYQHENGRVYVRVRGWVG